MRKIALFLFLVLWSVPTVLFAQDIPTQVKAQLESKGIPIFSGATYCMGEPSVGIRFATDETPEKVREWYLAKYPKWSIMDQYGSWSMYDGPPGAGMAKVMSVNRIEIKTNELLPSWHSLPSDMTTEVLIAFPD